MRWDKQNRTVFPLLWGKMVLREACPTSSSPPQKSGKSCREQSEGGSRDRSRCWSRQLRGCRACRCLPAFGPDFLFSILSICLSLCILSYSVLPPYFLIPSVFHLSVPLLPGFLFPLSFATPGPCRKSTELAIVFKKKFVLLLSFSVCCLSSLALDFSDYFIYHSGVSL